jgi:lipid-A-disaccharide synthase
MISAGEASGDRLGAGLARALQKRCPGIELMGMGGSRMADAGVHVLQDSHEVAVVGITEVVSHLPAIRRALRCLSTAMRESPPDLFIPIDFPDFNLRLAARAGRCEIPVVYLVSPQIWAWRRGRVHAIRKLVRRMLVLFPFETALYEEAGVPVSFVGHPVMEDLREPGSREDLCQRVGLDPGRPIIALLPGSRRIEIERVLPVLLEAAKALSQQRPELQFLSCLAPGIERDWFGRMAEAAGLPELCIHDGDFPEILTICVAGAVASGTASLEAAVVGLPIVVVYKVGHVSHLLAKMLLKLENISLPNLVAQKRLVPELVQSEFTPQRVEQALLDFIDNPVEAERVRQQLLALRDRLGGPGLYERAADEVLSELGITGHDNSR